MSIESYQGSGVLDWSEAYVAAPRYYKKEDGTVFGAVAINEGIETVLPLRPHELYHPDGLTLTEWRILLYSRTKQAVLGDVDFYKAMQILQEYFLDGNDERVLLKALSITELDALLRKARISQN